MQSKLKVNTILILLLSTLIGLDMSLMYIKESYSNFSIFTVGFILLCIPMIALVFRDNYNSRHILFVLVLILISVFFNQYISAIGNDYIEGTDGPFNLRMVNNFLNETSRFELYKEHSLFNENFYGLPLFSNITSILLNLSNNIICLHVTPIFGVASIMIFFVLVKCIFPLKLSYISTILFGWSITFVSYGIELRPENLGILYFIMLLYVIIKKDMLEKDKYPYSILMLIISVALVFTHSVATVHSITIITIFSVSMFFHSQKERKKYHAEYASLIILIMYIFYLMYTTNSFAPFVNIIFKSISNSFFIDENMVLSEKGLSATSYEIPIFITITVWFERILFTIGCIMIIYNTYTKKFQNSKPYYQFLLLWSISYIIIVIFSIAANSLNPTRVYRFFEIPLSIIKSIPLLGILNINFSKIQTHIAKTYVTNVQFIAVLFVILMLMVNSICLLPNWKINIELNEYHDKPYADFSRQDIVAGEFARNFVGDFEFVGSFRTSVIFGVVGGKKIVKSNIEEIMLNENIDKQMYISTRTDNKENTNYNMSIIDKSYKIYDNKLLSVNLITSSIR